MPHTRTSLCRQLLTLGVHPGDTLMVHSALRSVGQVTGGANVVIHAILDAIGPQGTLAAYVDFEPFFEDDADEIPVFDKRIARAALDHGALHEAIRTWPGAVRSDHPDAGVVAIGPQAAHITADHPFQYGYGEGSPFDKLVQAQVRVLLLGAPLDTISLLHFAEAQARIPDKRIKRYRRLMPAGPHPVWIEFEEFDTERPVSDALPQNCFEQIARDYLSSGSGAMNIVGSAPAYLFDGPDLVNFGIQWLERYIGLNNRPAS